MIRRIMCALAGAAVMLLWLALLLAGLWWLSGWFPPQLTVAAVTVVIGAVGLAGGALMAHPGGDQVDPEQAAFEAAVKRDLAELPVIADRWWQPRRRKAGAR